MMQQENLTTQRRLMGNENRYTKVDRSDWSEIKKEGNQLAAWAASWHSTGRLGLGDCQLSSGRINAADIKSTANPIRPFLKGTTTLITPFFTTRAYVVMTFSSAITLKQATRLSPPWRPVAFRHHFTVIVALSTFTVNLADTLSRSRKVRHATS